MTRLVALFWCASLVSGTALGNPTGGQVVGGAASISSSGSTLNINQSTDRAIINWQSFSIANGETTQFNQPGTSSAALNRVVGANLSEIYGTLNANGKVYLINPNGIVIGASGVINTAGFVASTLDVNNDNFMSGDDLYFSGTSTAAVANLGHIGVANGDVYLIARQVENSGTIEAPNGEVSLAGATEVLLKASGSDKMLILPASSSGTVNNTVTGEIRAAVATLKAVGGNEYALAINNGGIIRATGCKTVNGRVLLIAKGGTVQSTGTIQAHNVDGTGGSIETSGDHVTASGTVNAGPGGSWLIDPNNLTINDGTSGSIAAATIISALNGGTTVTEQTTAGGTGGNGDIFVIAPLTWTGTGTLSLNAYRNITIGNAINGTSGGLTLNAGGTITDTAALSIGTFNLQSGIWSQIGTLPSFSATNFELTGGTFLRALGGNGTSGTPYQITDIYGLQGIGSPSHSLLTSNFILANNIDATGTSAWNSGAGFVPIGTEVLPLPYSPPYIYNAPAGTIHPFTGTFNGNGYVINGLTIYLPSTIPIGLFGYMSGTVENVGVIGSSVTGYGIYCEGVGALVANNFGLVQNCYSTGTVTGGEGFWGVGGLVGYNVTGATVNNSYSSCVVNGTYNVGGLVGFNNAGLVENSYATGNVSGGTGGGSGFGGIAGGNNGTLENCYATGNITGGTGIGSWGVGGLMGGGNGNAVVENCYATGTVSGLTEVGGLLGQNAGLVQNCYWDNGINSTLSAIGSNTGTVNNVVSVNNSTAYSHNSYANLGTWSELVTGAGLWVAKVSGNTVWFMVEGATRPFLASEYSTTITNAHQLQLMDMNLSASYTMANNISMAELSNPSGLWKTSTGFSPVGNYIFSLGTAPTTFTGTFNGNGYTIDGLTINRPTTDYVGLFGYTGQYTGLTSRISNVGLTDVSIHGHLYTAALVGQTYYTTINGCYETGDVAGTSYVGGLVGMNEFTSPISNSYATGNATGSDYVGGLVGYNSMSSIISNSFATGIVVGSIYVGGLVGAQSDSTDINSFATGKVSGDTGVGGLVGYNATSSVSNCYATGAVTGNSDVGGFVGSNFGTLNNCYFATDGTGFSQAFGAGATTGVTGLTLAQMKIQSNFTPAGTAAGDWNFSLPTGNNGTLVQGVWGMNASINNGLPYFQWQYPYLLVTVGNQTVTYGSSITSTPSLGSTITSIAGLVGSDTLSTTGFTLSVSGSNQNAGTFNTIDSGSGTLTSETKSVIHYVPIVTTGTESITPAPITVTALGGSSTYGSNPTNPGLSASGLQNGQTLNVLTGLDNSFDITSTTKVGNYTLSVDGILTNPNYTVANTVDGLWTVKASPVPEPVSTPILVTIMNENKNTIFVKMTDPDSGNDSQTSLHPVIITAPEVVTSSFRFSPSGIAGGPGVGGGNDHHDLMMTGNAGGHDDLYHFSSAMLDLKQVKKKTLQ